MLRTRNYEDLVKQQYPQHSDLMEATEQQLNMVMDVGSTKCRSALMFKVADGYEDSGIFVQDSIYYEVYESIDGCKSPSMAVKDNLELIIKSQTEGTAIRDAHIVMGDLKTAIRSNEQHIGAGLSKIQQDATYMNIISNIAYMALLDNMKNHQYSKETVVDLTITLPPEDARYDKRQDIFVQSVKGVYLIKFPRLGESIQLNIRSIGVASEPKAAAVTYAVEHEVKSYDNILVIDCGGRDTGFAAMRRGNVVENVGSSVKSAGRTMSRDIAKDLSQSHGVDEIDEESILEAIPSGVLRRGNSEWDMSMALDTAKKRLASEIYAGIMQTAEELRMSMSEWTRFVCCGRSFGTSQNDRGIEVSRSLAAYISEICKNSGLDISVEVCPRETMICRGLQYLVEMGE